MDGDVSLLLSIGVAVITAAATIVLVLVTRRYAIATDRILAETQKDRETRWIEHRLRDIYQPILKRGHDLGLLHTALQMNMPAFPDVRLVDHLYLCDGKLRKLIKRFVEIPRNRDGTPGFRKMGNEIIVYVRNATDSMIKRLHELNTGQKD